MPYPPIRAFSVKGKIVVAALQAALKAVHLAKKREWASPPLLFHDDPRRFTARDVLFFAYKYYYRPPQLDDANGAVIQFFRDNPPGFNHNNFNKKNPHTTITLSAAGDLMPYEWIQDAYCPHLWDDIGDDFFSSDIVFANLETPIDVRRPASLVPEVMLSDMLFNGDAAMFDIFNGQGRWRGFDILSTANNHSLDMGEAGVCATLDFLNKKNIRAVGTAATAQERTACTMIEKKGIRVAFMAYTYSMNQFTNPPDKPYLVNHIEINQPNVDLTLIKNDVKNAYDAGADIVILSLHYGNAYQAYPGAHILNNTRRLFDECGVDIVLGGHPHNVQPMAGYNFQCPVSGRNKRGFVIFSLSDFVAYDIFTHCHLSVYLKLSLTKGTVTEPALIPSAGRIQTALTDVKVVPVYAKGTYQSAHKRDLRLLNFEKWVDKMRSNTPLDGFTDWQMDELRYLKSFYDRHFAQNLENKSDIRP